MQEEQEKQEPVRHAKTMAEAVAMAQPPGFKKKNFMRNHKCICGSGKKFKKCCWGRYK